jgi:hypothetical protein
MSSVDTSLKTYWNYALCFNRGREQHWLTFLQDMALNQTGIAQRAAMKFVSQHTKVDNESSTG